MAIQAQASSTALGTVASMVAGGKPEAGLKNVLTLVMVSGDNVDIVFDNQDDVSRLIAFLRGSVAPIVQ